MMEMSFLTRQTCALMIDNFTMRKQWWWTSAVLVKLLEMLQLRVRVRSTYTAMDTSGKMVTTLELRCWARTKSLEMEPQTRATAAGRAPNNLVESRRQRQRVLMTMVTLVLDRAAIQAIPTTVMDCEATYAVPTTELDRNVIQAIPTLELNRDHDVTYVVMMTIMTLGRAPM